MVRGLAISARGHVLARRLFEPIRRYLNGEVAFADIQRRLTQLPLLTARYVALLAVAVIGFRTSTPWWVESHVMFNLRPTIPDFIAVLVILGPWMLATAVVAA